MKRVSKSRHRRLLVMGTASVIAFVFLCINIFIYAYKITSLNKKQNDLIISYNELLAEKENLENEIEKLKDEDYLARYARETYLYTKKNEYVIKIQDKEEKIEEVENSINVINSIRKYVMYASIPASIVLIFIVLKKKS